MHIAGCPFKHKRLMITFDGKIEKLACMFIMFLYL